MVVIVRAVCGPIIEQLVVGDVTQSSNVAVSREALVYH